MSRSIKIRVEAEIHPTDDELLDWAGEEQFFLFCDKDEFLQIARAVMHRYMGRKTAVQGEPVAITDADISAIAGRVESCPVSPWWLKDDVAIGDVRAAVLRFARALLVAAPQPAPAVQGEPVALPPFATKIIEKLQRFDVCAEDGQDVDIGRHWLDMLVQLGLLNRVKRSPALWEMAQQGEDVLGGYTAPQPAVQGEAVAWEEPAANWLREKAAAQQAFNEQYPEHAKRYPAWRNWVLNLNWLADELSAGAIPQPADQQPSPDVTQLVEALDLALEYWRDRQQRYKNRRPKWVIAAESALAAYRKQQENEA